jgi:hypothetical protein
MLWLEIGEIVIIFCSRALETKMAHAEGAVALRWSPAVPHLLATLSRTGTEVKVFSCRTGQGMCRVDSMSYVYG